MHDERREIRVTTTTFLFSTIQTSRVRINKKTQKKTTNNQITAIKLSRHLGACERRREEEKRGKHERE